MKTYAAYGFNITALKLQAEPTPQFIDDIHEFLKDKDWHSDRDGIVILQPDEAGNAWHQFVPEGEWMIRTPGNAGIAVLPETLFNALFKEVA